MTHEEFFAKFDLLAELPDAVAMMRLAILDLAVTGGLANDCDGNDEASVLLTGAAVERSRLVAARKIRARRAPPLSENEKAFDIPPGWAWARLSDVGHELGQKVPSTRFTYIDVGSIDSGAGRIADGVVSLDPNEAPSRARKLVAHGTVIYSTVRPYLRNIAIVDRDFSFEPIASTAFGILHPFACIESRYLFLWLRSSPFRAYVEASMKGMAYPAINDEAFYNGPIAVPPLSDQRRIVAKVDELMALCDRLEAQQKERETRHSALTRASLSRFADAPIPANLTFLFHKSYTIPPADLRKSILTLAIQGRLVAQDPGDTSASELLRDIEAERLRFARDHSFRAPSPQVVTTIPFQIPSAWVWCRLGSILNAVTDGDHLPPPKSENGIAFLTIGNVTTGKLEFAGSRLVPEDYYRSLTHFRRPVRNDVLYTVVGATYGRPALVDTDRPFCIQRHIAILKPGAHLETRLLLLLMRSPLVYDQATAGTTGTAQPTVPLGVLRNFLVPLPPLAEQRRIVAKVDQLIALVDELEAQLAASRATATKLLDAIVGELTA